MRKSLELEPVLSVDFRRTLRLMSQKETCRDHMLGIGQGKTRQRKVWHFVGPDPESSALVKGASVSLKGGLEDKSMSLIIPFQGPSSETETRTRASHRSRSRRESSSSSGNWYLYSMYLVLGTILSALHT